MSESGAATLNWADECEAVSPPAKQQEKPKFEHKKPDMQRYRPGAGPIQSPEGGKRPLPTRSDDERANSSELGDNDLRHRLGGMNMNGGGSPGLEKLDLRHRLNQRSRDPVLPPSNGNSNGGNHHQEEERRNNGGGGGGRGNNRNQHRRVQGRGATNQGGQTKPRPQQGHGGDHNGYHNGPKPAPQPQPQPQPQQHHNQQQQRPKIKRNTENFNPDHAPCQMRVLAASAGLKRYNKEMTSRDVVVVRDLLCQEDDLTIYNSLLKELEQSGESPDRLWQLWHGDSHLIADDKKKWKNVCPTFNMVIERIKEYFDMDVKATRLNWYRDSQEWKPFHHDAAALKEDKAKTQNFTVAISFGMERDAAFEHAQTKTTLSMPQPNGTVYTFGKDVNVMWRHGILQCPPEKYSDQGRISIIAWGMNKQTEIGIF